MQILLQRVNSHSDNTDAMLSKADLGYLLAQLLRPATVHVGDSHYAQQKGVPQGGVISPSLFTLLLDDCIQKDNELRNKTVDGSLLAYADDIVISCDSRSDLEIIIKTFEGLTATTGLLMNKAKCAILCTRNADPLAPFRIPED